jgi:hypothetical protein
LLIRTMIGKNVLMQYEIKDLFFFFKYYFSSN